MMKVFDLSVGVYVRGLTSLKGILAKAETHAASNGIEAAELLATKLTNDMYDLAAQIHWASEGAKLAVSRLLGIEATPVTEAKRSFAELTRQIDATVVHLRAVDPDALEAGLERTIEISHRGATRTYRGDQFLTEFAIPNFFFHATSAYAILRNQGVPLRKGDFLGE